MNASHALLAALTLATTGVAGCIESPNWLNTSETEVSAFEYRARADDAARDWNPDAELVGVMAFELYEAQDPRIEADPDPGNGLAPAWWYVYCAEKDDADPDVRAFKVSADGTVESADEAVAFAESFEHDTADPLGEWTVDSDDALAAAKANAEFARVAEGFNASVVEGVAHMDDGTAWWVSAMSADGFVIARVDAVTGELLDVQNLDMGFVMPSFEWGAANPDLAGNPVYLEGEGTLGPDDEAVEVPFTLTGPVYGQLFIQIEGGFMQEGLVWAILDSEGDAVEEDYVGSWSGRESYEVELALEEAGDYTFVLHYAGGFPWMGPVPIPVGGEIDYEYTLDLWPGKMEHEH